MFSQRGKKYPVEVLTVDEIDDVMKTFKPTWAGLRNRALIALLVGGQLRISEALDLRPCDVDLTRGSITVQVGKGKRRRVVGLMQFGRRYIGVWVRMRPDSPFFFCSRDGKRMDNSYVRHMIKRIAKKAGATKRLHPHGFRHTGAYMLAEAGIDMHVLRRQLGHSNLNTTQIYIDHLLPEDVIDAIGSVHVTPRSV